jgi:hypothetical protein
LATWRLLTKRQFVKLILLLISYKYNRWSKINSLDQLLHCRNNANFETAIEYEKKFSSGKQQQNDFGLFPRREICILKTLENLSIKKRTLC